MPITRTFFKINAGPRENIEDTAKFFEMIIWILRRLELTFLVVCDGVGGLNYGEVASAMGTNCLCSSLASKFSGGMSELDFSALSPDSVLSILEKAFVFANQTILDQSKTKPQFAGMATTAVCALILDKMLYIASVGDSRCYLWRDGMIKQLTNDHSEVQQLMDQGLLTKQEAKYHPGAHTITQYLGKSSGFACETRLHRIVPGDVVMICTDGLTDVVPDREIADSIRACKDGTLEFSYLPQYLIELALSLGTTDNITVLCSEYQPENEIFGRTATGAYPVAAAKILSHLNKENSDVNT